LSGQVVVVMGGAVHVVQALFSALSGS